MIQTGIQALQLLWTAEVLLHLGLGILVGLTVGVLPGLGGTVGMAILLPFVFGMEPTTGIAMMIGFIAVGHTSDTFPSILLGVPGSGGSQATIMDGYPLARQGEASRALGASFSASVLGGVFGAIALLLLIQIARPLVLALGSPELLMMTVLGLTLVGMLSRGSALPGLLAGLIGLLLGAIGDSPVTLQYRYTFDWLYLADGIPLPVLALGLFALPEMLSLLVENRSIARGGDLRGSLWSGVRETFRHKKLVVQSSMIGVGVGMLPGLGGSVTDWIAYGVAQRTQRNTENFGKGDIRGVIAPESANNAKEGGTLIPTLLFGIPGSGTTAILLGGLLMMGIQVGPRMVTDNLDVTVSIVWMLTLANIVAAIVCLALARYIARISLIPARILSPVIFVIVIGAAYQSTRSWGDVWVMLGIGAVAYVMKEVGFPRAPILIGFVLSSSVERYYHLSVSIYGVQWMQRPGVIFLAAVTVALVYGFIRTNVSSKNRQGVLK